MSHVERYTPITSRCSTSGTTMTVTVMLMVTCSAPCSTSVWMARGTKQVIINGIRLPFDTLSDRLLVCWVQFDIALVIVSVHSIWYGLSRRGACSDGALKLSKQIGL